MSTDYEVANIGGGVGFTLDDNVKAIFGTGLDVEFYFDGTDMFTRLAEVATTTGWMIGLGASPPSPDGVSVHIWRSTAGGITANTDAMLILETEGSNSLQFFAATNGTSRIRFGDSGGNSEGVIGYDHSNSHLLIRIADTNRLFYSAGAFAFQEATTISTTAGNLTLNPTDNVVVSASVIINDDNALVLGTDQDSFILNRSLSLSADEELAGVIEGTSNHQGVAANSLIISNATDNGDILGLISDGGNSLEFLLADADVAHLHLGFGMINTSIYASGDITLNPSGSGGVLIASGRLQAVQGTDVASATNITLPLDGNVFELTGTTKVDLISNVGWQEGAEIMLVANENVTIDDGTATSGANITIVLAGGADFLMTAEDTLTLVLCSITATGQAWREKTRSAN